MKRAEWALCGGEISRQWLQQAATFVVAIMLGPVSAGAFFAAQRLSNLLSIGLIGTNQVSGPIIARSWHAGQFQRLQSVMTTVSVAALTFSLIGFGFYSVWGAWLLAQFDPAFSDAHIVLICLAFGQLVNAACGPNGHLLNLAGQEKATLFISIVAGIANILCTAIGITLYGLIGAAIGSTIATILWNVWCTTLCAKRLNIHLFKIHSVKHISGIRTAIFSQKAIKK
ncbi:lipopolysaccharide biosynthesis protein [Marivivens niveibacter]|nr:polysaccharide biosynthesis C-terminal domain-containing protein [Marivivens niveibacter]